MITSEVEMHPNVDWFSWYSLDCHLLRLGVQARSRKLWGFLLSPSIERALCIISIEGLKQLTDPTVPIVHVTIAPTDILYIPPGWFAMTTV